VSVRKGIQLKSRLSTGPDRPHDRPGSCVIGQQYSSAAFISLRLHYRKENSGARLKNVTIPVLKLIINRVSLKLRNLKLCKAGECPNAMSLLQTTSLSHYSFLKLYQGRSLIRPACCAVTPTDCTAAKASNLLNVNHAFHQCKAEIPCQEVCSHPQ
jgi:hypothetical protein